MALDQVRKEVHVLCLRCGYQLPDGSAFCPNCGLLQTPPDSQEEETEPHTCVILHAYRCFGDYLTLEHWFVAREEGPWAAYNISESSRWIDGVRLLSRGNKKAIRALRELVEKLRAEGWVYFGRGLQWYALRFRRRL